MPQQSQSRAPQEPGLVVILGTAHVSSKSAQDAIRVIQAVKPQNVVVELCRCASNIEHCT